MKIFSNFFNIIDYLLQKFQNFSANISEVIVDKPRKIRVFSENQHLWPQFPKYLIKNSEIFGERR